MENLKEFSQIKNIVCLGSGYVGVLTMTVLASYYPKIKIRIHDKFPEILEKWKKAGNELKEYFSKNVYKYSDEEKKSQDFVSSQNFENSKESSISSNINIFIPPPKLPIIEKNLEKIFLNVYDENLFFSTQLTDLEILQSDMFFICVNTPSNVYTKIRTDLCIEEIKKEIMKGISLDMSNVNQSLEEIVNKIINSQEVIENPLLLFKVRIIIQKSTVPIETLKKLHELIKSVISCNSDKLNKICEVLKNNDNFHKNFSEQFSDFKSINFTNVHFVEFYVSKFFPLINIPEFLAEGTAVTNLISPDRIILGYLKNTFPFSKKICENIIHPLYSHWIPEDKIISLDSNSSELTKLLSNAFLAQRISSINSITELCEMTNSNINDISQSVGSDSRIGKNYLKASMGFGGSCLKKDILSLIFILYSKGLNIQAEYWVNTLLINEYQRIRIAEMVYSSVVKRKNVIHTKEKLIKGISHNHENLHEYVTIFGLSFKGNTNDTRSSNGIFMISYLLNKGLKVKIWDPLVNVHEVENELKLYENFSNCFIQDNLEKSQIFGEKIIFCENYKQALIDSSAIVFCNNHSEFHQFDLIEIREGMAYNSVIFDLYDIFEEQKLRSAGFESVFKLGVYSDI